MLPEEPLHGAAVDGEKRRACFPDDVIDRALQTAPPGFRLYDVEGRQTHDLSGKNVHFAPGSAAIHILDHGTDTVRKPTAADYVNYVKLVAQLPYIASQSTAMVPGDVHPNVSDSYRLFLSLVFGTKPVVTGAFTIEGFTIMKDLLAPAPTAFTLMLYAATSLASASVKL